MCAYGFPCLPCHGRGQVGRNTQPGSQQHLATSPCGWTCSRGLAKSSGPSFTSAWRSLSRRWPRTLVGKTTATMHGTVVRTPLCCCTTSRAGPRSTPVDANRGLGPCPLPFARSGLQMAGLANLWESSWGNKDPAQTSRRPRVKAQGGCPQRFEHGDERQDGYDSARCTKGGPGVRGRAGLSRRGVEKEQEISAMPRVAPCRSICSHARCSHWILTNSGQGELPKFDMVTAIFFPFLT
jgi:hypothetical protein